MKKPKAKKGNLSKLKKNLKTQQKTDLKANVVLRKRFALGNEAQGQGDLPIIRKIFLLSILEHRCAE